MSFGIRALKNLKEQSKKIAEKRFVRHIVVGNNIIALKKYSDLRKQFSKEEVALFLTQELNPEDLVRERRCHFNFIRSEEMAKLFSERTGLKLIALNKVKFYKDGKFHSFNKRAKPMPLLPHEKYFKSPAYVLDSQFLEDFYNSIDLETFLNEANQMVLEEVEFISSTDLIERSAFRLTSGDKKVYECEQLYWGLDSQSLVKAVKEKSTIDDSLLELVAATDYKAALVVSLESKNVDLEIETGTYFLPQSLTHDWGHFIVDIENNRSLRGLIVIDEDELTTEELAKKVRLFKRVLKRCMNFDEAIEFDEMIDFDEKLFAMTKDTKAQNELHKAYEKLSFLGVDTFDDNLEVLGFERSFLSTCS